MAQRLVRAKRRSRRPGSRTGCRKRPTFPIVCRRCWPSSTWSSTRGTGRDWRGPRPRRSLRRGDPARQAPGRAHAGRARGDGLLALLVLVESRRAARTTPSGDLVLLADQDRRRWDDRLIAEGQASCGSACAATSPGRTRSRRRSTPSKRGPGQRGHRLGAGAGALRPAPGVAPSPVVALNRAVAVAAVKGPAEALVLVDDLDLADSHLGHVVRADLLARLDRRPEATIEYAAAVASAGNAAERAFLDRRRRALR